MTMKKFAISIALLLGLITPAFAFAQGVGATVNASAAVTAPTTGVTASVTLTAAEKTAISRADSEIARRVTALTNLNTRVQAMQEITDTFKQSLSASIQTDISNLTALKTKIDADTDLTTLKTDVKSVTQSYRIFALIIPQGTIAAAADREVTLVNMMGTLGGKLQARVVQASSQGANVTALSAALTDMSAKLQDAQTQAEASVTASASLTPDNGVAAAMASNASALKTARADIKAAQADLVAARKDITTIVNGLKALPAASASASSTTQVQTH
jgi:hypothetical protein